MNNIVISVKDKLSDEVYQKIDNLKEIRFKYGDVVYFSKDNIDKGQEGYRYNSLTEEPISDWPDENYVIIGIDGSIGDGGEPIVLKVDESNLPVYYFENLDWNYPTIIADSLDDYIKINNIIAEYSKEIEEKNLNEQDFNHIIEEIKKINDSSYWINLLINAAPSSEAWIEPWTLQ